MSETLAYALLIVVAIAYLGGAVLVVAACILASWQQKRAAIPAAKD